MNNLISTSQVRNISGAPVELISDEIIEDLITQVQDKTFNFFNITATPVKKIEKIDGSGKESLRLNHTFPLRIEKLILGENEQDLNNVQLKYQNSSLRLNTNQNPFLFTQRRNYVRVSYLSAFMNLSKIVSENTTSITAGSSVTFNISDDFFEVNDWLLIEDFEAKTEAVRVISKTGSTITVDKATQNHEEGSIITKLETHPLLIEYILYESVLAVAQYAVGNTYTFQTSFSKGDFSTNFGVPYPHWEKASNLAEKRRNEVKKQLFNILNSLN